VTSLPTVVWRPEHIEVVLLLEPMEPRIQHTSFLVGHTTVVRASRASISSFASVAAHGYEASRSLSRVLIVNDNHMWTNEFLEK
jgi:hypothetical protein